MLTLPSIQFNHWLWAGSLCLSFDAFAEPRYRQFPPTDKEKADIFAGIYLGIDFDSNILHRSSGDQAANPGPNESNDKGGDGASDGTVASVLPKNSGPAHVINGHLFVDKSPGPLTRLTLRLESEQRRFFDPGTTIFGSFNNGSTYSGPALLNQNSHALALGLVVASSVKEPTVVFGLIPHASLLNVLGHTVQQSMGVRAGVLIPRLATYPEIALVAENHTDLAPTKTLAPDPISGNFSQDSANRSADLKKIEYKMKPIWSPSRELVATWSLGQMRLKSADLAAEGYDTVGSSLGYLFSPVDKNDISLKLEAETRSYKSADDKRLDRLLALAALWRWRTYQHVTRFIGIELKSLSSSRDSSAYSQTLFTIGCSFHL